VFNNITIFTTFVSRLGLENYWYFDEHNLTDDTSYVNITTGNHVLQATDITVPGRGGRGEALNFHRKILVERRTSCDRFWCGIS
jgi:hypothetical protein